MRRLAAICAAILAALAASGCGLGPGKTPGGLHLTVTQDFGVQSLVDSGSPKASGSETVMRLLERNAKVTTRYGGGFVQSIDGLSGKPPVDWFYYVNGVEASKGAASTTVHPGDRIWWDRHDWSVTQHIPAVIGSFPEPFLHGTGGKRLPVRVECGTPGSAACATVVKTLVRLGVPAAQGAVAGAADNDNLRVLVGPWPTLRIDGGVAQLQDGPRHSGVYARVSADGHEIQALDARGHVTETLGAGTGLIAASEVKDGSPFWIITGTDAVGVTSAVRAFADGESAMHDKFAMAIGHDRAVALPTLKPR